MKRTLIHAFVRMFPIYTVEALYEMFYRICIRNTLEKSEYAVTSNELKNQFDIPIQLFLSCIGYQ